MNVGIGSRRARKKRTPRMLRLKMFIGRQGTALLRLRWTNLMNGGGLSDWEEEEQTW
jgi:hypothetical protein